MGPIGGKEELAIKLAMLGRWEEAAEVNKEILEKDPQNVDALNRLGKALLELGRFEEAEQAYRKALEIDPANQIARKNLEKVRLWRGREVSAERGAISPDLFIEEAGKSCPTEHKKKGEREVILRLRVGEKVFYKVEDGRLIVEDSLGNYIGEVRPKIGARLIKLMEGGNRYEGIIAGAHEGGVKVLLREIYRHPSQLDVPSFPLEVYEEAASLRGFVFRFDEEEEGGEL